MSRHPTLLRQLRRLGIEEGGPPDAAAWATFLDSVERVYRHADEDRYTMERSLELSSAEMHELYDRLAAQETARRVTAEGRLDALVKALPGAVFRFDVAEARVSYVSEGIVGLAGRPVSDFVGVEGIKLAAHFHPDDVMGTRAKVAEAVGGGGLFQAEVRLVRPDGEARWVLLRATPRLDDAGRVVSLDGLVLDHQEAHAAADAQREAMEIAQANTRAKSEFLANVSHELRTPLNAVLGFSGLLLEADLPPAARELAAMLHQSGEGLLALIGEVLDFSKIEARKIDLAFAEFDLEEVLDDCLAAFSTDATARGIALGVVVAPSVPMRIVCDRTRVRQVLDNLVGNAIKFTERGLVRVDVGVERAGPERTRVRFTVTDTGVGIPEPAWGKLFQPFSQVDATSTRRFGGTGLGLAIARELTELMGGAIGFDSKERVGSRFWFEVPFKVVRAAAPVPLAGLRVLLVDSSEASATLLAERLEAWGADVARARDVLGALVVTRDRRNLGAAPDVVVVTPQAISSTGQVALVGPLGARRGVQLTAPGSAAGPVPEGFVAVATPARGTALRAALWGRAGAQSAPRRVIPGASRLRVLVAEDNPVNQRVITLQLAQFGIEPGVVVDGAEAVRAFEKQGYDLVLMDCQMPNVDGLEATRLIREIERGRSERAHIVALTAHAQEGERQRCFAAGMDDFVTKPIRLEQLGALIEQMRP